jgi:hypothetical protein
LSGYEESSQGKTKLSHEAIPQSSCGGITPKTQNELNHLRGVNKLEKDTRYRVMRDNLGLLDRLQSIKGRAKRIEEMQQTMRHQEKMAHKVSCYPYIIAKKPPGTPGMEMPPSSRVKGHR